MLACWALMSWYKINDRRDRLLIHDDGTLDPTERQKFAELFPGCQIILREDADREASRHLARYPALVNERKQNSLLIKVLDFFFFATSRRIIIMDSDVLSFKPLRKIEQCQKAVQNVFMRDNHYAFNIPRDAFLEFGPESVYRKVNSGFGFVNIGSLDLELADYFVRSTQGRALPFWGGQTLSAIFSAPYGIRLLDRSCQVAQGPGLEGITMKHYVGGVRSLAYTEGIPYLARILKELPDPRSEQ